MSTGIEFDSESSRIPVRGPIYARASPEERGMAGWLIRKGVVRNKTQAGYILIAVIVINMIVMWLAFGESFPRIGGQSGDPILETLRAEEKTGRIQQNAL